MYFYLARNGRFYHNSFKTEGVKNAQICVTACFNEDRNLVIYDVKRIAGTETSALYDVLNKVINYAKGTQFYGTKCIINMSNKIPACYLRKVGFDTVDGCTLFNIG